MHGLLADLLRLTVQAMRRAAHDTVDERTDEHRADLNTVLRRTSGDARCRDRHLCVEEFGNAVRHLPSRLDRQHTVVHRTAVPH